MANKLPEPIHDKTSSCHMWKTKAQISLRIHTAFVIRCLDSKTQLVAAELLVSVAEQAGLSLTWLHIWKGRFYQGVSPRRNSIKSMLIRNTEDGMKQQVPTGMTELARQTGEIYKLSCAAHSRIEPLMTKPTMWLCAQWILRSAWASAQFDQSLRCPHEESLGP